MTIIAISKAQADLCDLVDRCRIGGETFTITKGIHKKPVAQLVPVGGPEHEEINNSVGPASRNKTGARTKPNGGTSKDFTAGSEQNGKRRVAAK